MRLNHFLCKFGDTPWPVLCQIFIACLGSFSSGLVIGSTNVPFEGTELCWEFTTFYSHTESSACSPMDNSLWYFYLTSFSVTACISSFCGGSIITKYGRLQPLIYNNFFYIMGAVMTSLAAYPVMFGIGRMLSGIACGMTFLVVPIYISEISQFNSEKIFCTLHQAFVALGILVSSLLGIYGSVAPFWRLTYGIVLVPAILQTILLVNCVETPHYLLLIGQEQKARENLGILFDNPRRINNELVNIIKLIAESNRRTNSMSEPTTQRSGTRQEKTQIDEPETGIESSAPSSSSAPAVTPVPTALVPSSLPSTSSSSRSPSPFLTKLLKKPQLSIQPAPEAPSTPETSSTVETPSLPEATLAKTVLRTSPIAEASSSSSPSKTPLVSGTLNKKERLYKKLLAGEQPDVSEIDEAIAMLNENNIPPPKPTPRKGKERASTTTMTTTAAATTTRTGVSEDLEIAEIVYAASSSSPTNVNISSSSSSPDSTNATGTPVSASSSYPSSLLDNMYHIASTSAPIGPQFAETSNNISSNSSNSNRYRSNNTSEDANRQEISYDKIWSLSEVIADKHNRNILILATGALVLQQLTGIHIIIYYSTRIFSQVLSFDVNMGANLSVGITICYFYTNLFSVFLLNRFSCHRKLFLLSCGSTFIFSILFVIGYGIHVDVLAVVAVYGYVVAFTIGFGVIPPMMLVQLTTPSTVASINAFAHSMGWMMNVLMGQCLPLLMNAIGGYTFAIFAGFAVLAIPFGIIVVSALFKGGDKHYQFYLY